jgi:hypothetical protein
VVDQNAPHHLCGDPEKLRAILPGDPVLTHLPRVRLMDERRGLQRVIATLIPQVGPGSTSQFAIHKGHQVLARASVSLPPRSEQITHAAGLGRHLYVWESLEDTAHSYTPSLPVRQTIARPTSR